MNHFKSFRFAIPLAIIFLLAFAAINGGNQEQLWHQGSIFGEEKKFISHDIVEYKRGQIWIVGGLAEDGKLYYFTRIWEGGQTVESEPKLISEKTFLTEGTSTIFLSEKDSYLQFSISTKNGIECFWIDPEELFPKPIEIPQKYRVNQLWKKYGYPIYMSPFFAKCIAINRTEYSWEKKAAFIDYIVVNVEANSVRMFAFLPFPKQCHIPHPKRDGKYVLEEINEEWRVELHRVIKYCVDRGLTVRLIITDSCGATTSARRWNDHWLNPENNHGFRNKPTYWDQYGLLKWINYAVYDGSCTPEEKERYETNRDYFLWFFDQIIPPLHAEFKDFLSLDMNEVDTADTGHGYLGRLFQEKYNFPRWRMITSPRGMDWINEKPQIRKYWIPSVHGIFSVERYDEAMDYVICNVFPSGDGGGNDWYEGGYSELRQLLRKALEDRRYGFDGNNWIPDNCDFSKLDHRSAEIFMEELERFIVKNN